MSGKRYYFAYGSNMDNRQIRERCPDAVSVSMATLRGYRFIINTHGVATVVPDTSGVVYGILWNISKRDEESLDVYEGVRWGTYRKDYVDIEAQDGKLSSVLIYIAGDSDIGSPWDGYMERIISAAEKQGLPEKYIEELRSWLRQL
ncbi:MAG: gamma-glutamylcyclotransferase family protein [Nitrospinota bacterium]